MRFSQPALFIPVFSIGDICAIGSGFFWAFSVILMRVSGFSIRPIPLTFFKCCVSIVGFFAILLIMREPLFPKLEPIAYLKLAISAILGITIADTMFAAALNRLGASLQALADCIYAPSIAMVGFLMFGESLSPLELIGGALVVSGVFVGMVVTKDVDASKSLYFGVALAAGAHVTMAVGILMVRDIFREISLVWVAGYRFSVATVMLGLFVVAKGQFSSLGIGFKRRDTWKTTIPMSLLGPFLATLLWIAGFKYEEAGRAAIFNQMSTVFIIILAWLILKEEMTKRKLLGLILAILGAILVAGS